MALTPMDATPNENPSPAWKQTSRLPIEVGSLGELPLICTKRQLAAALSCSTRHLENLISRGLLRPVRLGRLVRFRRDAVMRALAILEGAG
jgi:excisionase family DNA binding protein